MWPVTITLEGPEREYIFPCRKFYCKALSIPGTVLLGTYTLGKVMVLRTVNKQDPYFGGISREEKVLNTRVQYKMS